MVVWYVMCNENIPFTLKLIYHPLILVSSYFCYIYKVKQQGSLWPQYIIIKISSHAFTLVSI